MKVITILLGIGLVISIAFNVMFWQQLEEGAAVESALRLSLSEFEKVRSELEGMKNGDGITRHSVEDYQREQARLRNEVAQLRRKEKESEAEKARLAAETAALKNQVSQANANQQSTGANNLTPYDAKLAELANLTPEQIMEFKADAQSVSCVSNMKQMGLALRTWANEHQGVFPPDLISVQEHLRTPRILFCPAAPGGAQTTNWALLNPGSISYQYLNANGSAKDLQQVLITCLIHGHIGRSDASVERSRR